MIQKSGFQYFDFKIKILKFKLRLKEEDDTETHR
jgi:hypothetical protein